MLQVSQLGKRYDSRWILRDLSFSLPPGSCWGILGPNGCGKSTLLRCLAGDLDWEEGEVYLGGQALLAYPPRQRARRLAWLSQDVLPPARLQVLEAVRLGRYPHLARLAGLTRADEARIEGALRRTATVDLQQRSLQNLSGGERQRVSWAQIWAQEANLLLLDEPCAHLDVGYTARLVRLLQFWRRSSSVTSLIVLHDWNLAAQICDGLILLKEGRIVAQGLPTAVLSTQRLEQVYGIPVEEVTHANWPLARFFARFMPGQE